MKVERNLYIFKEKKFKFIMRFKRERINCVKGIKTFNKN